jgi:hypothetical protein
VAESASREKFHKRPEDEERDTDARDGPQEARAEMTPCMTICVLLDTYTLLAWIAHAAF